MPRRVLGIAILAICVAASALLAADQLHRLNLPGCAGAQSGCQALTAGRWGMIGRTGWPVSFVGIAYFVGLLAAWLRAPRTGVPWSLRWLTRLGLVGSAWFLGVMY